METDDWRETLFCYFSADSFEPETLKARLDTIPDGRAEFRSAFDAALMGADFDPAAWSRDLNFHFGSGAAVSAWLGEVYDFLFKLGPEPKAPARE